VIFARSHDFPTGNRRRLDTNCVSYCGLLIRQVVDRFSACPDVIHDLSVVLAEHPRCLVVYFISEPLSMWKSVQKRRTAESCLAVFFAPLVSITELLRIFWIPLNKLSEVEIVPKSELF
jgi:hypothetical protein